MKVRISPRRKTTQNLPLLPLPLSAAEAKKLAKKLAKARKLAEAEARKQAKAEAIAVANEDGESEILEDPDDYFRENGDQVVPSDGGKSQRIAILIYFVNTLDSPDEAGGFWDGQGGIVNRIRKTLSIPPGTDIKSILKSIKEHETQGIAYTGDRIGDPGGRPPFILA
jgi:hypothetical protein